MAPRDMSNDSVLGAADHHENEHDGFLEDAQNFENDDDLFGDDNDQDGSALLSQFQRQTTRELTPPTTKNTRKTRNTKPTPKRTTKRVRKSDSQEPDSPLFCPPNEDEEMDSSEIERRIMPSPCSSPTSIADDANDVSIESPMDALSVESPVAAQPPKPAPKRNLAGLKRARAHKKELSNKLYFLHTKPKSRPRPEEDPENHLIKTLRQEHKMSFEAIANYLNDERTKRGEIADLTKSGVYGRWQRHSETIATILGEIGFDQAQYMHIKNALTRPPKAFLKSVGAAPAGGRGPSGLGFGSGAGQKRGRGAVEVEDQNQNQVQEQLELKGNVRQKVPISEQAKKLKSENMTEMLMKAVDVVERNFWPYVADQLERESGVLFDPGAVESRFRAI